MASRASREPQSRDGSDVFTPADSATGFAVEPVKRALEEAAITNVAFECLSEITRRLLEPDVFQLV